MLYGPVLHPVRRAPRCRASVELRHQVGLAPRELGLEQVAEEVVVPVPAAAVVERDDEQVRVLELCQRLGRVGAVEDRIAQRRGHPVEHRGPREELDVFRPQLGEVLRAQVVRHEPVVAAEARNCLQVGRRLERERGEVEPRGPAFGACVQRASFVIGHLRPGGGEEQRGLAVRQRELGRPDLEQLAVCAEAGERERGLVAPGEHELRPGRHVQRKCVDRVDRARIGHLVHVVEDEDDRARDRGERRAEPRDSRRPERVAAGGDSAEDVLVDRLDLVQRRGDVAQDDDRVVVGSVEGHPCEAAAVARRPLHDQGRLAVARRSDDADEPGVPARAKL